MQQILNRRVIDVLQRDGDDLRSSRTVRHWIYFQASFDRFRFAELARGQGFDVTESDLPDDGVRDRRFCCLVSRLDFVDDASINETVLLLFDNARACDGEYDGWETQVIKLGEPRA
jgi:regulator of RNase E activity RraB